MRDVIVVGNWKMNMTLKSGSALVSEILDGLYRHDAGQVKVIIAPPFPFISPLSQPTARKAQIFLAAQNCHHEKSGAFTGEVSAETLASFDCGYCIVGHSERREYFHEDDTIINLKIQRLLENGVKPIFCCGELLDDRESEKHFAVVEAQLKTALQGFKKEQLLQIVVAYEPVWAIGTGKTATPAEAQEMHAFIREKLALVLGDDAQKVSILYGGSVKPDNAKELFAQKDIDGGLIGGASLLAEDFLSIIHAF